jgi:hypothetical protein
VGAQAYLVQTYLAYDHVSVLAVATDEAAAYAFAESIRAGRVVEVAPEWLVRKGCMVERPTWEAIETDRVVALWGIRFDRDTAPGGFDRYLEIEAVLLLDQEGNL